LRFHFNSLKEFTQTANKTESVMKLSRRSFLKTSGILASGAALTALPFSSGKAASKVRYNPFGVQLYTLRDVIGDDPKGIIRQLADFGYKQIESYEGSQGIFWGMGHMEFKSFLDDLGLEMVSSHAGVQQNFRQKAEQLAEVGAKFITQPWVGPQETLDDFKRIAERFNELGEIAKEVGLKFAYHNHAYTFERVEGEFPQDVLMEMTDPDLVDYQLDIYWVVAAGHDPNRWFRNYPGRFTSCHVKDYSGGQDPESVVLGTGTIDFQDVISTGMEYGLETLIVEQEAYTGTTPMGAVRQNAEFLKNLKV
jgi:sugar phosphate isomerase/epimerase